MNTAIANNEELIDNNDFFPTNTPVDVAMLLKEHGTKSSVIRYLAASGMKRGAIAKLLDIRYQHVRNVLVKELKRVETL